MGAVLSQVKDDEERVIAYMSKTMNVHERVYCVTRKELLAVIVALRNFHTYLYGQNVLLRTDNAAVSWMRNLKKPKESIVRLELVFQRLSEANLKLKPSKCILFQHRVKFLGHIVSEEGVSTDPDKIMAVKEWSSPRSAKQVRSFLGLCSYFRRFVRDFAQIARPLHKLCEKGSKFLWSKDSEDSFQSLN